MQTEKNLIKLIGTLETRILKCKNKIDANPKTILFWQGAKCEAEYLHNSLCKLLKKQQKRISVSTWKNYRIP